MATDVAPSVEDQAAARAVTAAAADRPTPAPRQGLAAVVYQLVVIAPFLFWLLHEMRTSSEQFLDPAILFWIVAVAVVDLMPIATWGGLQLSLSFPIQLAVAMLYPPPVAAAVALIGSFDPRELRREISPLKAAFIRTEIAISGLAEAYVFHKLGSIDGPWYQIIPAVAAATVAGYIVNIALVAFYVRLSTRTTFRQAVARMHVGAPLEFLASYAALALYAAVIARFYIGEGFLSVLVFVAPLAFARQMFFRSRALEEATHELKEREQALQSLSDRLAEQNALLAMQARQLEDHLEKEQQAVAELRELNRLKSDFVATASHELRTPLTTIIGCAKSLMQPAFAQDAAVRQEFLEAMNRQSDRLLRLVENLLATSKVEDNRLPLSIQRVVLADVCREVVEGLGEKATSVSIDMAPGVPVIQTDRQLLGRIVFNLLDNAVKYSPPGSPIRVRARRIDDSVELSIVDHGIGIPADELEKVFDRFYQVDSSATRTVGGVGLGLSLVKTLLVSLAGDIRVESEAGVGSTFTVTLPIRHPGASERPSLAHLRGEMDVVAARDEG